MTKVSVQIFLLMVKLLTTSAITEELTAEKFILIEDRERDHEVVRREVPSGPPIPSRPPGPPGPADLPATDASDQHSKPAISTTGKPSTSSKQSGLLDTEPTIAPGNQTRPTKTIITEDHHIYYKSRHYIHGEEWWYDLENGRTPTVHEELSKNLKFGYDMIKISFKYPFYGHIIDYVTITNKGYVFLGDRVHKFNASSQYVAPLMADFTVHDKTKIRYVDTGDRFTVEWSSLLFKDLKAGEFSFQCSILKNGTLVFAYKNIPVPVVELKSKALQVRVGLTDSYLRRFVRRGIFRINGKIYTTLVYNVYYRYHAVELPMEKVKSDTAFVITPLPNCVMFNTCDTCVNTKTSFDCAWCPELQRCSDGFDRHRQQWLYYGCDKNNQTMCPTTQPKETANMNKTMENKKQGHGNKTIHNGGQGMSNTTMDSKNQENINETTDSIKQGNINKTANNNEQQNKNKTVNTKQPQNSNKTAATGNHGNKNRTITNKELENANKTTTSPKQQQEKSSVESNDKLKGKKKGIIRSKQKGNKSTKTEKPDKNDKKVKPTPKAKERANVNKTIKTEIPVSSNKTTGSSGDNNSNEVPPEKPNQDLQPDGESVGARTGGSKENAGAQAGKIFAILLAVAIVLGLVCWLVYAYRYPQTKSGRFLIEHRNPKKWFRKEDYGTTGRFHFKTRSMELKNT